MIYDDKSQRLVKSTRLAIEIIYIPYGSIRSSIEKEIQKMNFIIFWRKTGSQSMIRQEDKGTKFGKRGIGT